MFLLVGKQEWGDETGGVVKNNEDAIERQALAAWMAKQKSANR